jgi:hypothetical protein
MLLSKRKPENAITIGKMTTISNLMKMKKLIKEISWVFDYYFAYFMYNERTMHRYNRYMIEKWGERFKKRME